MRLPMFIGGLLLAALPKLGTAQTIPPLPPRPVHDSAFAVHQLFKKHRHAAEGALATGAASIVGIFTSSARGEKELVSANALITVVATAVGLRQALRYSPDHEQALLRQYEQGWPLPPEVRRRLKPKYFRAM
ncbi:hypothetical protein MON38_00140 [Hymenobacter sp. DH14]|uniref:Uncharacterized protein n=1 Tax=Hymenobacter cyanobacteriorum TaxID=2926463 RepID=A0A9X2AD91_9BACT|nr:hypothetical protein [Hymenobacter cyanobacteriorum]MCI1185811.1 hypothetical protein [Hymenobacter cyanobacteriorum]